MITQEDYNRGTRCKGAGFNCPSCGDRHSCIQYKDINSYPSLRKKPPIGIMPREIWESKRIKELRGAIERYNDAGVEVPEEWINELSSMYHRVKTLVKFVDLKEGMIIYDVRADHYMRLIEIKHYVEGSSTARFKYVAEKGCVVEYSLDEGVFNSLQMYKCERERGIS